MKEILVLGAGYTGLKAVRQLQKQKGDFHITLVDRNDYHYEATELHEVAAGSQPKEKISYPIMDVICSEKVTFIQDEVTKIDADQQMVTLRNKGQLTYDYVVVSLGFTSETFGIPGAKENALQMVTVEGAEAIHHHILEMMSKYQETKDKTYLRLLICGAGFTGIELAGAFVDERKRYAKLAGVNPEEIEIICVEAATRILPMFDDKLAQHGVNLLKKLNVNLMTGSMIKEIKPGQVMYVTHPEDKDFKSIEAKTIVWTSGVSGSPVMGESGFNQRRGRVMVNSDLRDPAHESVYVIGDVSAFMDKSCNQPFPTTAQIATRMGTHVAKNILHQLKGEATEDFSYKGLGTVASVGNTRAFGVVGKTAVKSYPASVIKKSIMNKSLLDIGGLKELLAKGRFDLYH
ncbi:NAD(P)/FAD-dependent oxidoreductase [Streptococcus ictaluri]|uniref:Pyridine nucleotide-disulfide oxidoreductase n=1 Tax=Streptococcus ictaluri 707-05 TaxID=764299 RepID=G5K4I8_9STRE|nr:NAD(P)/FAD-dependent oxidoreductase [Streptococcus ictaluri]EHI69039.1 pyridine nucleotide-disulfide oxidoreductase [Streptococcus ictaluri 707-05]